MKSVFRLIAALALLFAPAAYSQTAAVVGTNVIDNAGGKIVSGQWCLGSTCFAVTNGLIAPGSTVSLNATGTVTVQSAGTTVLTVPGVVVGRSIFNWNTYVVQSGTSIVTLGKPLIACAVGAKATQSDASTTWACTYQGTTSVWAIASNGQGASGIYAGIGAPTFNCVSPCLYIRTDASSNGAFYALQAAAGTSSNNWILQAQGPPGIEGPGGVASLSQLASVRLKGPLGLANVYNEAASSSGYINGSTGAFVSGGGFEASDFMPTNAGGQMVSSGDLFGNAGGAGYAFYDENFAFISGGLATISGGTPFSAPANSAFLRVTFLGNAPSSEVVVYGTTLPPPYTIGTASVSPGFGTYAPNVIDAKIAAATSTGTANVSTAAAALTRNKLAPGANYFNLATSTGGYIQSTDGTAVVDTSGTYVATDFMPANSGGLMSVSLAPVTGAAGICFYDGAGAYQSCTTSAPSAGGSFAVPASASFVRMSFQNPIGNLFIAYGSSLPSTYVTAGTYAPNQIDAKVSTVASAIGGVSNQIVRAAQPLVTNIFDPARITSGLLLHTGLGQGAIGTTESSSGGYISDFLPVASGQVYTMTPGDGDTNANFGLVWYDVNRAPLSAVGYPFTDGENFTAPAGAVWARFTMAAAAGNLTTQMFVTGSSKPSSFIPFVQTAHILTASDIGSLVGVQSITHPLFGKKIGVLADSIGSIFGNKWQTSATTREGSALLLQDARPGRTWANALECYGAQAPGSSPSALGPYSGQNNLTGGQYASQTCSQYNVYGTVPANGTTLAQNLANVDALYIALGTNDEPQYPVGSITDAYTAGTQYGNMRWVLDCLLYAKPTLRIVLIAPAFGVNGATTTGSASTQSDGTGSTIAITPGTSATITAAAQVNATNAAILALAQAYSLPVVDLLHIGGITAANVGIYTRDGTHPTDPFFITHYGPMVAQGSLLYF